MSFTWRSYPAVVLGSVGDRESLRVHFLNLHSGLHLLDHLVVAGFLRLFGRVADVSERRPRAHLDDDGLHIAHGDDVADLQVVEPCDLGIDIDGLEHVAFLAEGHDADAALDPIDRRLDGRFSGDDIWRLRRHQVSTGHKKHDDDRRHGN